MRCRRTQTALLCCVCFTAAPAFAQRGADDGVSVDPDSPAATEYRLPLDSAREDAAGADRSGPDRAAPLFGAGAQPPSKGAPAPRRAGERATSSSKDDAATTLGSTKGASAAAEAARVADDDGLPADATIALGALLVLVVGGVIGLALRRPRRSPGG